MNNEAMAAERVFNKDNEITLCINLKWLTRHPFKIKNNRPPSHK